MGGRSVRPRRGPVVPRLLALGAVRGRGGVPRGVVPRRAAGEPAPRILARLAFRSGRLRSRHRVDRGELPVPRHRRRRGGGADWPPRMPARPLSRRLRLGERQGPARRRPAIGNRYRGRNSGRGGRPVVASRAPGSSSSGSGGPCFPASPGCTRAMRASSHPSPPLLPSEAATRWGSRSRSPPPASPWWARPANARWCAPSGCRPSCGRAGRPWSSWTPMPHGPARPETPCACSSCRATSRRTRSGRSRSGAGPPSAMRS